MLHAEPIRDFLEKPLIDHWEERGGRLVARSASTLLKTNQQPKKEGWPDDVFYPFQWYLRESDANGLQAGSVWREWKGTEILNNFHN